MAWSSTDFNRLRRDVGVTSAVIDDTEAEDLLDEGLEAYPGNTEAALAQARVIAIGSLMVQAAYQVDYKENQSEEKASQRYKALAELLARWEQKLEETVAASIGAARWGQIKPKPTRLKDYPNA